MKPHRFIGNFNLKTGNLELKDKELFNQMRNVLRLEVGDEVMLCDGKLNEARVKIIGFRKDSIEFNILEKWQNQNEPERHVVLYCSILKKENFELVVQKATEIGVSEIVPVIAARTVKLDVRKNRLEKIIKEAAEQSGRGIVPVLHDPVDFKKAIDLAVKDSLNILFDSSGSSLNSLVTNHWSLVTIFIGPEGGWTSEELEAVKIADFEIISLGKLTLRAETAAIIASYISTV